MEKYHKTQNTKPEAIDDEINLRELFSTVWRYKKSIFFFTLLGTLLVAAITYRMPEYYKTSTTIEVKPKGNEHSSFSLGSAGALLGLPQAGGTSTDKDAALLKTYRINNTVLNNVYYGSQFYAYERYQYTELAENNCSITIPRFQIHDYKKYGISVLIAPSDKNHFKLLLPGKFKDTLLGEFSYDTPVRTEYFDLEVHPKPKGRFPDKIVLNGDKRYIFKNLISKNFTVTVDKTNPFIKVSYLDTLPKRGEAYVKALIDSYIKLSIGFEVEDANITLDILNKQIKEIEGKVHAGAGKMEKFKAKRRILEPALQAQVLIQGKDKVSEKLTQVNYQLDLLARLIRFTKNNKNIDTISSTLTELQDQPSIALVTKLQELQLEATSLSQEFKPAYPKLKSIHSQIRNITSKIKSNLKNLQKTLKSRAKSLQKIQNDYTKELQGTPTTERKMTELLREYKYNEKLYTYLLQKRSAAEIKKAEAISRFRTIEVIYTDRSPSKPKKLLIVIVGFLTILFLSIFLAFFRDFLKGTHPKNRRDSR